MKGILGFSTMNGMDGRLCPLASTFLYNTEIILDSIKKRNTSIQVGKEALKLTVHRGHACVCTNYESTKQLLELISNYSKVTENKLG